MSEIIIHALHSDSKIEFLIIYLLEKILFLDCEREGKFEVQIWIITKEI